ncbi:hypothetical protein P7K49_029948 [Saguinus oedipus]|uniref:Uncharacterized protein n=1 Tax=Saguinus oedipus TaxID=9490 RepID=A0ABQ9U8M9_SAGOE|nr:hypothetical protein P7K49_029948 [Saguinus oedipus]
MRRIFGDMLGAREREASLHFGDLISGQGGCRCSVGSGDHIQHGAPVKLCCSGSELTSDELKPLSDLTAAFPITCDIYFHMKEWLGRKAPITDFRETSPQVFVVGFTSAVCSKLVLKLDLAAVSSGCLEVQVCPGSPALYQEDD